MALLFRHMRRVLRGDRVRGPFRPRMILDRRFEVASDYARHDVRTAEWHIAYWAVVDHRRGWTYTLLSFKGDFAQFERDVVLIRMSR